MHKIRSLTRKCRREEPRELAMIWSRPEQPRDEPSGCAEPCYLAQKAALGADRITFCNMLCELVVDQWTSPPKDALTEVERAIRSAAGMALCCVVGSDAMLS